MQQSDIEQVWFFHVMPLYPETLAGQLVCGWDVGV
jgi:hypothetical protein